MAQPARSECAEKFAGSVPATAATTLDDQRDGPVGQARRDPAVAIDCEEHRALGDAGGLLPRPQRRHGAGRSAGGNHADDLAGGLLVGLAAP